MWANESAFYQIYPLGFCGAPFENDGNLQPRILKVLDWVEHIKKLGTNAIYFSPVFESDTHGYNTRDYQLIDRRLGTNEDFKKVCDELHKEGIKVVLDGVFNHAGRGFFAFQDVLKNRESSRYVNWFARIDFGGNSGYNDGLWYEGWEGNYDLVKLNLFNEEVVNYLFESVRFWIEKLAGRIDILHLKAMGRNEQGPFITEIGNDNMNWAGMLESAEKAGVKYFVVEQDIWPGDPFDSIKQSSEYLHKYFM